MGVDDFTMIPNGTGGLEERHGDAVDAGRGNRAG